MTAKDGRMQRGQAGELAAQRWFIRHGWRMVRTQPAMQILGVAPGKRYGTVFTVRMTAAGGVPDYTGYIERVDDGRIYLIGQYLACEVKEAQGDTMPASRLDKSQRDFLNAVPSGNAYVGILWDCGTFEMFDYREKGSYKKGQGG